MVLFPNFAEESATITLITSLKVSQNARFGSLSVLCTTEFLETLFFWTSSQNACQSNTKRTLTEQHRTDREWIRNGYGTDTEQIGNGYGTDTERIRNGYGMHTEWIRNGYRTDTEWEWEHVWNGNSSHSVKRSLLDFFWSVLYSASHQKLPG